MTEHVDWEKNLLEALPGHLAEDGVRLRLSTCSVGDPVIGIDFETREEWDDFASKVSALFRDRDW